MAGIQMGGLASGLDTQAIISQLMAVERMPRFRLERQQAAAQTRQDALRDIVTKLKTLKQSASDLQSAGLWTAKQTATTTDAAKLGARVLSSTAPGTYDIEVTQRASAASRTLTIGPHPQASDITITDSAGNVLPAIAVPPDATVDQIVAAFDATPGLPVAARNVNGALVLDARTTGTNGDFTVTGKAITGETASAAGANALFTVNGAAHSSQTNTDTAAIPGTELALSALTTPGTPVRVTVTQAAVDKDAVTEKLKKFVESYNAVVDTIRGKLSEKRVPNPQTMIDAKKGVLFADAGLSQTLSSLRMGIMEPVAVGNSTAIDELAEIGISTGAASAVTADKTNGKLVFDEAKFKAAWDGDQASVERLLHGSGSLSGFAQRLDGIVKPLTEAGGVFDGRISAAGGELSRLKDGLTRMDLRLERKELFYRRQFTALETALQRMQSQSVDIASRLPQPSSS